MKPPPARPRSASAGTLAWPAALNTTGWLLAVIVLLAGLVGALHDHGPAQLEEAPDAPSASLFALTPHAIIRDATHVAIVLERQSGSTLGWKVPAPGLPTLLEPSLPILAVARSAAWALPPRLDGILRGAAQARGPPGTPSA